MSGNVVAWVYDRYPVRSAADRTRKIVLSEVAEAATREFNNAHPGVARIVRDWHLDRATVHRALKELVADGWLEITEQGGGRGKATVYRVCRERVAAGNGLEEKPSHRESETGAISDSAHITAPISSHPPIEDGSSSEKPPRPRNDVWDAIARACLLPLDTEKLTKAAKGMLVSAATDIRKVGGTAAQVPEVAAAFRAKFPGATLTPTALAKWWPSLVSDGRDDDEDEDPGPSRYDEMRNVR